MIHKNEKYSDKIIFWTPISEKIEKYELKHTQQIKKDICNSVFIASYQ